MKTITRILMVDGSAGTWIDDIGKKKVAPEIAVGTRVKLRFDLRQNVTDDATGMKLPVDIDDIRCDSYCLALDNDYDQETAPKLLKIGAFPLSRENGYVYLEAEIPDTAVPGLLEAVGKKEKVELKGELSGYSAEYGIAAASFAVRFSLVICNRVYLGNEVPDEVINDPAYLNAVQIYALLAELERPQPGPQGATGPAGRGITSIAKTNSQNNADTYTITLSDGSTQTFAVTNGTNGRGIASIEKTATKDNIDTYTITFSDDSTFSFTVVNGEDGRDIKPDAYGELSERDAYADRPQGFTFRASIVDPVELTTKVYTYMKRSDDFGDWFPPLIITYYSRDGKDGKDGTNGEDGEHSAMLKPLDFKAKGPEDENKEYIFVDLAEYSAATISAVCIDTDDGELMLPYYSAFGVRKIIRDADHKVYIYFGSECPEYKTGRIYFSQGVAGLTQYQLYLKNGGMLSFGEWCNNKGIASITKTATEDNIDTYTILYSDNTVQEFTIVNGKDGQHGDGLSWDKWGPQAKLHLYDSAAKGFVYLVTDVLTDEEGYRYCVAYRKESDAQGDWSEPVRFYGGMKGEDGKNGKDFKYSDFTDAQLEALKVKGDRGENSAVKPDAEFLAAHDPEQPGKPFVDGGSVVIEGIDPIAAVELYDEEGNGIVQHRGPRPGEVLIRTCYVENHTVVYLGSLDADQYAHGGRIRFAQGLAGLSPYQIWLKQGYEGSEADYLNWTRGAGNEFAFDDSAVNGCMLVIDDTRPAVAVIDESGRQYPFALLDEVTYRAGVTSISLAAIMTYRNLIAIPGTWKIVFAVGPEGKNGRSYFIDKSGLLAERDQYNGKAPGFKFEDADTGRIYTRLASGGWSSGFLIRAETPADWYDLDYAANLTLDPVNGCQQRVALSGDVDIAAPVLSTECPTLVLQLTVSRHTVQINQQSVLAGVSGVFLIGWYYDGSATRRHNIAEVF